MNKRYSSPGIVVTAPEPIEEETETPLIGMVTVTTPSYVFHTVLASLPHFKEVTMSDLCNIIPCVRRGWYQKGHAAFKKMPCVSLLCLNKKHCENKAEICKLA